MEKLIMKDWKEWQSYRSDRGAPPWIKVYRNLFTSRKWAVLTDAEKGHLVSIWLVAADNDGAVPSDANMLRKMCQLDDVPNIKKFIELEWMTPNGCQDDVNVTPSGRQDDAPETETETETDNPPIVPPSKKTKETKNADNGETLKQHLGNCEVISAEWANWCSSELGWSQDVIDETFAVFTDYWTCGKGRTTRGKNWFARWKTWCRKDNRPKNTGNAGRAMHSNLASAVRAVVDRRYGAASGGGEVGRGGAAEDAEDYGF